MSFVQKKKLTWFDVVNYSFLMLISFSSIFPFLYIISVSFTDPSTYVPLKFYLLPDNFSIASYKQILSTNGFMSALKSTVFIALFGTVLNVLVSFTMAYGLTKKSLPGRSILISGIIFTLVFNVGIIPNYLLVKNLGLLDSYWSLIWPSLTNAWSLIVIKSFLESLPSELEDAAIIDGCSEIGTFIRIIVPLSTPAIAAFTLFFAVSHWNTSFNALINISDSSKWTLQVFIKTIVIDSDFQIGAGGDRNMVPKETVSMAAIVLSMVPILIVYPFLQKYFAKGVMLGSVKG
jgi:putative aldouronate transport system permease protein